MNNIEKKREAVNYYEQNGVLPVLETLLNNMFQAQPKDIYGYMCEYFGERSQPFTVEQVTQHPAFSEHGFNTIYTTITCFMRGKLQDSPFYCMVDDRPAETEQPTKPSTKNKAKKGQGSAAEPTKTAAEPAKPAFSFEKMAEFYASIFAPSLVGAVVTDQSDVDQRLKIAYNAYLESGTKPLCVVSRNSIYVDTASCVDTPSYLDELRTASLYASLACANATTSLTETPYFSLDNNSKHMPVAAMEVLTCSTRAPRKLNLYKRILISPKQDGDFQQGIQNLLKFYKHLEDSLKAKNVVYSKDEQRGTFSPVFEKMEMVFDLLTHTCTSYMQQELPTIFNIVVDVHAKQMYDKVKGKYDTGGGSMKSGDELVTIYTSWKETYPVVVLIDPISQQEEKKEYKRLSNAVSLITQNFTTDSKIYDQSNNEVENKNVESDNTTTNNNLESENIEREDNNFESDDNNVEPTNNNNNGVVLQPLKTSATLTDLKSTVTSLRGMKLMVVDNWHGFHEYLFVDMAIAFNCDYIQVFPNRVHTINKLCDRFLYLSRLPKIACDSDVKLPVKQKESEPF